VRLPHAGWCGEAGARFGLNDRPNQTSLGWAMAPRAGARAILRANATDGHSRRNRSRSVARLQSRTGSSRRARSIVDVGTRLQPPWAGHPLAPGELHLVAHALAAEAAGQQRIALLPLLRQTVPPAASRSWGFCVDEPHAARSALPASAPATALFVGRLDQPGGALCCLCSAGRLPGLPGQPPARCSPRLPWKAADCP